MSDTNYVILTVASVDFDYRETMTKLMSFYSKDLIENAKKEAEFLFNNFKINSKKLEQLNEIFQNKNALISLGG